MRLDKCFIIVAIANPKQTHIFFHFQIPASRNITYQSAHNKLHRKSVPNSKSDSFEEKVMETIATSQRGFLNSLITRRRFVARQVKTGPNVINYPVNIKGLECDVCVLFRPTWCRRSLSLK